VSADLVNATGAEVAGVLEATIGDVRAPAGQTVRIEFSPADNAALNLANPAL